MSFTDDDDLEACLLGTESEREQVTRDMLRAHVTRAQTLLPASFVTEMIESRVPFTFTLIGGERLHAVILEDVMQAPNGSIWLDLVLDPPPAPIRRVSINAAHIVMAQAVDLNPDS